MKNGGEQWQVDDDLLTETGRGGLFTDGYLQGEPLVSYFEAEETPLFVFGSGKRGVTRTTGETTDRIVPSSGYRAITAITDRRVQFVVGGGGETDGDWAASIRLSDIDRVVVNEGLIRERLTITADGTDWQVYLKDVETDRVVTFLEDVSWAWIQVEELIGDARKRLVDASQYQKSRAYEDAQRSLSAARAKLDEASDVADSLAPAATTGIRERIEQVESRYRETKRRAHSSRATHCVDAAERQWREDAYQAAYESFADARAQYEKVLDISGIDPDKADAIRERIDHVDGNLDHLASAPLRRAHGTRRRALDAEDPESELAAWTDALDQYRTVLELDWGKDDKRFDGDVDLLRDRVAQAVDGVLSARRALTTQCRERGDDLIEAGDLSGARESYADAITHLEAARDLAHEFDPSAVPEFDARLDELAECISQVTANVSAETDSAIEAESAPEADAEPETATTATAGQDETEAADDSDDYDDFDNWVTLSPEDDEEADTGGEGLAARKDPSEDTEPTEAEPVETDGDRGLSDRIVGDEQVDSLTDVRSPDASMPPAETVDAISSLQASELRDVVTELWAARGWSTTQAEDVVVATRSDGAAERLVILVADERVTTDDIEACLGSRDEHDAERATLVTTDPVETVAESRAAEAGVEILDTLELAVLLDSEGLSDVLPDATA